MNCPKCNKSFKNLLAVGVHQSRSKDCYDPEAIAQRARDRDAKRKKKSGQRKMSAEWYREYRKKRADYRAKEVKRKLDKRKADGREDRTTEYANRNARRVKIDFSPIVPLFPEINHGATVSYWNEELAMDLLQERALAELEGRDPEQAVKIYKANEYAFKRNTMELLDYAS